MIIPDVTTARRHLRDFMVWKNSKLPIPIFNEEDEVELMSWNESKVFYVYSQFVYNIKECAITDLRICMWCVLTLRTRGIHKRRKAHNMLYGYQLCHECKYEKRNGNCMYKNSTYNKIIKTLENITINSPSIAMYITETAITKYVKDHFEWVF